MISPIRRILDRRRTQKPVDETETLRKALRRREAIVKRILALAPLLRTLLVVAGLLYTLALPHKSLGRGHYVDENALQPGQVCSTRSRKECIETSGMLMERPHRSIHIGTGPTCSSRIAMPTTSPPGASCRLTGAPHGAERRGITADPNFGSWVCRRSRAIKEAFQELGLPAVQQPYRFDLSGTSVSSDEQAV